MKKTPFIFLAFLALTSSCYSQARNDKKTGEIHLTTKNEPGKPFTLDMVVLDIATRQPVPGVEIFLYHTNNKGDYERDASNIARIHGTVFSDQEGKVRFHTIYPRGYNDSPRGAHIHFVVKARGYETQNSEIMFDDYKEKKYDRNNLKTEIVYVEELVEKENAFTGKATMYVKKR